MFAALALHHRETNYGESRECKRHNTFLFKKTRFLQGVCFDSLLEAFASTYFATSFRLGLYSAILEAFGRKVVYLRASQYAPKKIHSLQVTLALLLKENFIKESNNRERQSAVSPVTTSLVGNS